MIVADLNPRSQGMRARRRTRPLVPVRELNAQTAEAMRARIERRGFAFRARSDYQLSRPVPQLMHLNETKLGGALSHPLVWFNALGSAIERTTSGRAGAEASTIVRP